MVAYLDDILITGTSDEAHLTTLGEVLCRLESARLTTEKQVCIHGSRSNILGPQD